MAAISPPKPWERGGTSNRKFTGAPLQAIVPFSIASKPQTTTSAPSSATTTSQPPAIPTRPSTLTSVVNQNASNYSAPYGAANRLGNSPFTGLNGGYGTYSSPYSRLGGVNSIYGGGYGGMYGGYGGYGGMGGMYGAMPGMGGMGGINNDPNSLTNSFSQSTQATFQMMESLVGAFGGFAQMLESTYMTTHSSFFAMISVAEQFSNLRTTLGSVLGIFTLMRWLRTLFAKVTGRPPPADATALTPSAFASFQGLASNSRDPNIPATPSRKPFIFFLLAVFGLPYLMSKLIRSLASQQEQQQPPEGQMTLVGPNGQPLPSPQQIDQSQITFCRLLYDYTPPNPIPAEGIDLTIKKGDLVVVLSKLDPVTGKESEWWRCRARDGRVGYLPGVYLEEVGRRKIVNKGEEEGRLRTMTDDGGSRTGSLTEEAEKVGKREGKDAWEKKGGLYQDGRKAVIDYS